MTRRILPLYGFKPYNQMVCLSHPLHPVESGLREAAINWKMPLQIVRNVGCRLGPSGRLLHGCEVITGRSPEIVPASLGMKQIPGQAVSLRSAELLAHIAACPLFGIPFSPSF